MSYFGQFSLDKEKDILVDLYREGETLHIASQNTPAAA